MSTNDQMFEVASRMKFRFHYNGIIQVEDLWDLSLTSLDSLLETQNKKDEETLTKIEIVKHVVSVKLAENEIRKKARERKEQRAKLMEIMSYKKDESLQSKSLEELSAMLNELEG